MELFSVAIVAAVGAIALFTFLAVATFSEQRRMEREAFYRSETLKKLADKPGPETEQILQILREEQDKKARSRREGLKLGGLITTVVGIGLSIFLYAIATDEPVWTVGLIPFLIGLTLLVYVFSLAPKPGPPGA